jgi:hypothetical protein
MDRPRYLSGIRPERPDHGRILGGIDGFTNGQVL